MKMQAESKSQSGGIRCWNGITGCGKTIYGCWWNDAHCLWEAPGYNPSAHLCVPCSQAEAERASVEFADLSFVYTAHQVAKAGKFGRAPTRGEVWANLEKMGIKRKVYVKPADNFLPPSDRL